MRYFKTQLFALAMAALPLGAAAQAIEGAPDGYKLVWSDEFNGTALNEKNWNIEVSGAGGGNQELQYYRRENVSVADGNLVLTARRENFEGKAFTSGRINSNQKAAFKHGIMQAKIKFPKTANGLWPAYWMMGNDINKYGWPRCGEIDIVEMGHYNGINWGLQDRYFSGTLHYGPSASNEDHQMNSQEFTRDQFNAMSPVEDEYHIFTVEWDGDYIYVLRLGEVHQPQEARGTLLHSEHHCLYRQVCTRYIFPEAFLLPLQPGCGWYVHQYLQP